MENAQKEMNLPFTMFVVSDLHLELCRTPIDKYVRLIPDADILILAGDIGLPNKKHFVRFIKLCSESNKHNKILFIPGNHEYWSKFNDSQIKKTCCDYNINILQNDMILIDNIAFIGTTLWTNLTDLTKTQHILTKMNDFNEIPEMNLQKWNSLHNQALKTIKYCLKKCSQNNTKCIIITHHSPCIDCTYKYDHHKSINKCYFTDLSELFDHPNLLCWIFGHTHKTLCKLLGKNKDTLLFGNSARTRLEYNFKLKWFLKQNNIWNTKYVKDIKEYER